MDSLLDQLLSLQKTPATLAIMKNLMLGIVAFQKYDYKQAQSHFHPTLSVMLNSPSILEKWDILFVIINTYIFLEDFQTALSLTTASIKNTSSSQHEAYNKQGIIYSRLMDYDSAIASYKQALIIDPDNPRFMENLANAYLHLEHYAEALMVLEKAYESTPTEILLKKILEASYDRQGSCDGCGANSEKTCCTNMHLTREGHSVKNEEDYQAFLLQDKRNENWIKKSENERGEWLFTCKYLAENAHCTIHSTRPDVCRRFPETVIEAHKREYCSYNFSAREGIEIKSEKVKTAIQAILAL